MMATEPPGDDPAARSVSSQLPPHDLLDDLSQRDVSIKNGLDVTASNELAVKPSRAIEEQLNSAEVSLSGGSDTEASRADWSRQRDADKGHGRSASSTKKPTTFKAVSVNKTFLASKISPNGAVPKPADKPASGSNTPPPGLSSLSSSRPRLIAKTGAGARDSTPRYSSLGNSAKPVSAPDPGAVWNKNRPPEPKKFTDEELKKYGIHMASRLNEDDTQGQNKWADIDEDDEDWAPEAITWGDGTKTALPHLDEPPAPTQDTASVSTAISPRPKPKSPAPLPTVKPPAPKPSGLAPGRGLVLKAASSHEKPSLVAKPSVAPATSVKSPWATLPPVDRGLPGLSDSAAVVQAQPKEGLQNKSLHPQPKGMTADDFSRSSWRDGSSHASRELYNSQSGRYEPVPDRRRGTSRSDLQAKQPALLQRLQPTDPTVDGCGPQQASRVPQDGPHIGGRRSSSASIGNDSLQQQRGLKSLDPAAMGPNIRPSQQVPSENPVSSGEASTSTSKHALPKDDPNPPRTDNTASGTTSAPSQGASSTALERTSPPSVAESKPGLENELEYQKKLMREGIELARKRRQAEEAREEAARKERIQKKLEALGPPPEKRSDKKESSPMTETSKPTQIQQRERPTFGDSSHSRTVDKSSPRGQTGARPSIPNPPQSPQASAQLPSNPPAPAASASFRRPSQGQDSRRNDPWGGPGPRPDRLASWGSVVPPTLRNVWGSPDNDRGLGNGTFNPDLGRVTNTPAAPSQHAKGSLPIAPPTRIGPPATLANSQAQASQASPTTDAQSSRYVPPGSDLASKWVASVAEHDQKVSNARLAERASRERQFIERGMTLEDSQPVIRDSWRHVRVSGDGTRHAMEPVDVQSHQAATWKPAHDSLDSLAMGVAVKEDAGFTTKAGIIGCAAPSQSRWSRFFPARDYHQDRAAGGTYCPRSNSPTPPPPTMEDHPVYEGDVVRPHVSLPKPQPVVKLPPAMASAERDSTRPHGTWPAPAAAAAAVVKEDQRGDQAHHHHHHHHHPHHPSPPGGGSVWQARFNRLLHGDKPSPARDIGVDASSRGFLEPACAQTSAVVLLPSSSSFPEDGGSRSLVTKPMAEECFEEQEMGSLPQIRLPHKVPEAAWQPATVQPRSLPKRFSVQASVMEPFRFSSDSPAGARSVNVLLPGMKETKTILLPGSSSGRGPRASHGQRTGGARHRGFGNGPRSGRKEKRASQDGDGGGPHRSGRAGFRNKNPDSWTRQKPSKPSS